MQFHVVQHINHDVDTLLMPQLRHGDTIPDLASVHACLPIGALALHVMMKISVWRLSHRRDTAAMRNETIAARPAQSKYCWRVVRREIISREGPPSPWQLLIVNREVPIEECEKSRLVGTNLSRRS